MKRMAIVGSGIAGLGCAHFLRGDFDITVFEQNAYAGGHSNTVASRLVHSAPTATDSVKSKASS